MKHAFFKLKQSLCTALYALLWFFLKILQMANNIYQWQILKKHWNILKSVYLAKILSDHSATILRAETSCL